MRIFITAGDPSGDAHAARLMASIRKRVPDVLFEGFGGPAMEMEGLRTVAHMKDLAVTGFWEVAKRIGYFRQLMQTCERLLDSRKPDLFIPVDYPGFNLRLAARAKQRHIPAMASIHATMFTRMVCATRSVAPGARRMVFTTR